MDSRIGWLKVIGTFVGVVGVVAAVGGGVWALFPKMEERGQFGDMFGLANALFSGLAFAGVIYALVLQMRELALQREELRMTRAELTKQATAQAEHARTALLAARISGLGALLQASVQRGATYSGTGAGRQIAAARTDSLDRELRALLDAAKQSDESGE